MYKLTYKLNINNKEISQILNISKTEVLIEVSDNKLIFFKELNEYFSINSIDKKLDKIDNSKVVTQIEQVRKMVGDIKTVLKSEIYDFNEYSGRVFDFNSPNSSIAIKSDIKTVVIPNVAESAMPAYQNFEQQTQIVSIPFVTNEVLAYNRSEITTPQGVQIQEVELIKIEMVDCSEQINEVLSYQMAN